MVRVPIGRRLTSKAPPGVSTGPDPPRPNARRQSFAAIQQTLKVLPCPRPNGGEFDIQAVAARLRSSANMADRKPCDNPLTPQKNGASEPLSRDRVDPPD